MPPRFPSCSPVSTPHGEQLCTQHPGVWTTLPPRQADGELDRDMFIWVPSIPGTEGREGG